MTTLDSLGLDDTDTDAGGDVCAGTAAGTQAKLGEAQMGEAGPREEHEPVPGYRASQGGPVLDLTKGHKLEEICPPAQRTPEALSRIGAVRLKRYHISMQRLIELRAMFADADQDANGDLNDAEIVTSMQRRGALRTETTIKMANRGGRYKRLAEEADRLEKLKMVRSAIRRFGGKLRFTDFLGLMLPNATRAERAMVQDILYPREVELQSALVATAEETADIEAIFRQMDEDGSGELDIFEFKDMMRKLGVDDPDEIGRYFKEIDEDESGLVDFEEFRDWWVANGLSR